MAKVIKATGFECPGCGEIVPASLAKEHLECLNTEEVFQCSDCETWYLDRDEAKECCE